MADQKLTDLTATTSPASTDLVYLVVDPAGSPLDRKVTVGNLRGPGAILAHKSHSPASNYAVSATSATDVDATNLVVTFVAPTSGSVLVDVACVVQQEPTGNMFLYLRESSTTVATRRITNNNFSATAGSGGTDPALQNAVLARFEVTGLTPGSSHTYKLAASVSTGTGYLLLASAVGPILITVIAL